MCLLTPQVSCSCGGSFALMSFFFSSSLSPSVSMTINVAVTEIEIQILNFWFR